MITIGNRVLIDNFPQLQIPIGYEAKIDVEVHGWKLKITVQFLETGTEQSISVQPSPDGVRLVFQNWSNPIGTALKAPAQLAVLATGGVLEFLAANYRIGEMNLFSLQLLHNKEAE